MSISNEQLDIINEQNKVVGTMGKSIAHKDGLLFRDLHSLNKISKKH